MQLGHSIDKVEFIVMGGTFMSLPEDYRDYFIRNLHDALSGHTSCNVKEAVAYSERSKIKCIGITIETRPDYCLPRHLNDMLLYGCTRLEIGVQSTYETWPETPIEDTQLKLCARRSTWPRTLATRWLFT